jgi:hypothetical protein
MESSKVDFQPFPKIHRLSRDIIVTEKIDGTNAQVIVGEDGTVRAGSRNRLITPEADNYGFAAWVKLHEDELRLLGPGRHYGEWWGQGIQRGYGLKEKRFSLFNVSKWFDDGLRPKCCHVVPLLYSGMFSELHILNSLESLRLFGSKAAGGFMRPEGIVIFHTASGHLYKKTIENDEKGKVE